jgi:hypothetical protein
MLGCRGNLKLVASNWIDRVRYKELVSVTLRNDSPYYCSNIAIKVLDRALARRVPVRSSSGNVVMYKTEHAPPVLVAELHGLTLNPGEFREYLFEGGVTFRARDPLVKILRVRKH